MLTALTNQLLRHQLPELRRHILRRPQRRSGRRPRGFGVHAVRDTGCVLPHLR